MTHDKTKCEYCGTPLPLGVDKPTRQIRSRHFDSCPQRLQDAALDAKPQCECIDQLDCTGACCTKGVHLTDTLGNDDLVQRLRDYDGMSDHDCVNEAAARIEEMEKALDVAEAALDGFDSIMNVSSGVAGYHLNGDITEWGEFDEVNMLNEALAAIKEVTK